MRFMWKSNAPWAGTGYGAQTKLLLKALLGRGHEPHCFAFYGLAGGTVNYDGYKVWPNSDFENWGNDVIKAHLERSHAEMLITLMDLFVLNPASYRGLSVPWFAWTPIDSEEIGPETIERLKMNTCNPIAMSLFGREQMRRYDIEPIDMIYHAVDTDEFKPMDKDPIRDELGIEADFLIGMVMANKGDRKQYPRQLSAVKQFMDENKDLNVKVYLHTEPTAIMGGWDMKDLVKAVGLTGLVYSTNQYDTSVVPALPSLLAKIYNACDVVMNCSAGEGFGIPIVEAQACGVPVITHNVTAMPELTHNGYTVEPVAKGLASHYGWQFAPDIDEMAYRLNCVYRMSDSLSAQAGRQWVVDNCNTEVIADQWHALIEQVELMKVKVKESARKALV